MKTNFSKNISLTVIFALTFTQVVPAGWSASQEVSSAGTPEESMLAVPYTIVDPKTSIDTPVAAISEMFDGALFELDEDQAEENLQESAAGENEAEDSSDEPADTGDDDSTIVAIDDSTIVAIDDSTTDVVDDSTDVVADPTIDVVDDSTDVVVAIADVVDDADEFILQPGLIIFATINCDASGECAGNELASDDPDWAYVSEAQSITFSLSGGGTVTYRYYIN